MNLIYKSHLTDAISKMLDYEMALSCCDEVDRVYYEIELSRIYPIVNKFDKIIVTMN